MRTPTEIVTLYNERVKADMGRQQALQEIERLYQGDIVVKLPEMGMDEAPAVANIARSGIDQIGQRIASVFYEIDVSPNAATKRSKDRAALRRRAFYAFHEQNRTQRKLRRRARYLMGYASAPVRLSVDFERQIPRWEVRSPLGCYPAPVGDPDEMVPADCIFASIQTLGWLERFYPESAARLRRREDNRLTSITVLEFIDADGVYLVGGRREVNNGDFYNPWSAHNTGQHHTLGDFDLLNFYPNRTERPLVVIPGQITLGPQKSPFHQIKGMYQAAAELDAWARHATAKGINQELWFVGNNEMPVIHQPADPLNNVPGIVEGGSLQQIVQQPQFAARTAVGDYERNQRLTAGLPAELGGEAATNVRTGRRGDQLLSAVLDFPVQEAHQLFEEAGEIENEIAALIDLRYFRNVPKVWSVNFMGEKGDLAYTPGDLWTKQNSDEPAIRSKVSYYMAGMDAQNRAIAIGQRIGMGTMSQETGMRHDPMVDDVDAELRRIRSEELGRAFMAKLSTMVADPNSPVSAADVGMLRRLVRQGSELEDAWEKVQEAIAKREREAQEAAQQAQMGQMGPEGMMGPPPEQVVEGQVPAIGPPPEGASNLSGLLTALRSPEVFSTPGG